MRQIGLVFVLGCVFAGCGADRTSGGGWTGWLYDLDVDGEPASATVLLSVEEESAFVRLRLRSDAVDGDLELLHEEEWDGTAVRDGDGWDLTFGEAGWTGRCEGFRDTQLDCTGSDGDDEVSVVLNPPDVPQDR